MTTTTAQCVCCGKPVPGTEYACSVCGVTKPTAQLRTIADMTPAARDVAHGQARRGGGGASGKPGSQVPLDLGATSKLDAVQNELSTWVRHIADERGVHVPSVKGSDVIVEAAEWLLGHLGWLRHRQEVSDALSGFAAAARVITGITSGPAERWFLGPCGATVTWDDDGVEAERDSPCEGDVYARHRDAKDGACSDCGARWTTAARRAWLDGKVRERAFRASEIAKAYRINVNTIRSWATRGLLASYWRTSAGLVTPWIDPPLDPALKGDEMKERLGEISDEIRDRGGRLHYVGDVLDLAASEAARRAGEQAKRARRAAVKANEETAA